LSPADKATITGAAQAAVGGSTASPPLADALTELDAATIRRRWFDSQDAATHRRIGRLDPDTITARLTADERDALIACDRDLIAPIFDATTRRTPWIGPQATPEPITLPRSPDEQVMVLIEDDNRELAWALGSLDGATVHIDRPHPDHPAWDQACHTSRGQNVAVEHASGARRLHIPGAPGLSSLALGRPDLRPGPGEAALLRLPDIVVIAPESLAGRVAAYAHPAVVRLVAADALPATPGHHPNNATV
jgi:hypothetical protein